MKKILVHLDSGQLYDIVAPGAEFPVAAGLQWFDAPDDVAHATHEFDGAVVVAKPPKPLAQVQAEKLAEIDRAYDAAVQQPVAYMGTTFQADYDSQATLTKTLTALTPLGAVPPGFSWWDADNNAVPMTLAELAGLAAMMLNQGWVAFQNKQAKKQAARDAQTVDDVNAVVW